jgi:hypothetical protein
MTSLLPLLINTSSISPMSLARLFFVFTALVALSAATHFMSLRAELESSIVCYERFAPDLWNAFESVLPGAITSNVDAFAAVMSALREALRNGLPPCTAAQRALQMTAVAQKFMTPIEAGTVAAQCRATWVLSDGGNVRQLRSSPLNMCLSSAHATGRAAAQIGSANERATSANAFIASSKDESMTFGAGSYSHPLTQAVVDSIKKRKK